jgi:26S proteasome regulatory subunit N6
MKCREFCIVKRRIIPLLIRIFLRSHNFNSLSLPLSVFFLQAFDAYDQAGSSTNAVTCLQYMILCKVLNDSSHEVPNLLSSKIAVKHSGKPLEAMSEIAKAARVRSLEEFKRVVLFSKVLNFRYISFLLCRSRSLETYFVQIILFRTIWTYSTIEWSKQIY